MPQSKPDTPGLIYEAIPRIMAAVGAIAKTHTNQQQRYNFRGIDDVYAALDANADRLAGLITTALSDAGVAHQMARGGSFLSVFFGDQPVRDFAAARAGETWRFPPFFQALLDGGVYAPPSAFETWFVSAALDDEAFSRIADALPAAARAAAEARPS